jgi:hypothetical protein
MSSHNKLTCLPWPGQTVLFTNPWFPGTNGTKDNGFSTVAKIFEKSSKDFEFLMKKTFNLSY